MLKNLRGRVVNSLSLGLTCGLAAAILAPAQVSAGQCSANVVGYWPLDGDGAEAVTGFAGTSVGTVSFVPGQVGQAASLGGDGSYIDAGMHAELSSFGGDEMSVAAWVLREPWPGVVGDGLGAVITARTGCNAGNFQLYAHLFTDELYFSKWASPPVTEDEVSSSFTPFPTGAWKHIAATYNTNEVRFYVDGALVDTVVPIYGGLINDEVQDVQLGWDSCSSYWTGLLDEIIVYSTTLSGTEIGDLYQRGVGGVSACSTPADLIAALVGDVIGLNLKKGITNSLDAKLDSALNALEDLNSNNDVAAVNSLQAFINAVQGQRGQHIPEADADALIASAQAIIDLINAS